MPDTGQAWEEMTDADFEQRTRGGIVVALIYSRARGHDPERILKPAAGMPYDDTVHFAALDADANPETPERYQSPALPALVCLRNGVLKQVLHNAAHPEQVIQAAKDNACYRCSITHSRTQARKQRGRFKTR